MLCATFFFHNIIHHISLVLSKTTWMGIFWDAWVSIPDKTWHCPYWTNFTDHNLYFWSAQGLPYIMFLSAHIHISIISMLPSINKIWNYIWVFMKALHANFGMGQFYRVTLLFWRLPFRQTQTSYFYYLDTWLTTT